MNEEQQEEYIEAPEGYEEQPEGYIEEAEDEYQEEERIFDEDGIGDQGLPTRMTPQPEPLGGIYGLFKEVLKKSDTTRVTNLSKEELGELNIPVRNAKYIALICRTFHHPGVATFFDEQAKIINETAMSKGGWFANLFISSKREASRTSSSISNLPQPKKQKWRIFGEDTPQQPQ